jgi:hypothetical protein
MKRFLPVTIALILILQSGLNAIDFSAKDKSRIYTEASAVLVKYQEIINRMGEYVVSDIEKARSESEALLELFVNRQVMIYNDLDPSHKLSQFYEAESYSSNILLWYPDGITVTLDFANARVSDIMAHEDNIYSIDLLLKKSINGNYLNQTMNKNVEELTFRIAFSMETKTPSNYKIVGIRSATSSTVIDYTQALREVNAENLTSEDLDKIHQGVRSVVQDYNNFLNLLGDPQETAEDKDFYKTSFLKLFPGNDIKVYNDIMPEPQTSLISASDYLSAYIADYPNGIKNLSINPDSAKMGKVMKSDDGRLYTYVNVNKFFSGPYKGKEAFRKMFPLIFKVSFAEEGKAFSNYLIMGIDISSSNFYDAASGGGDAGKIPELVIQPVTRKGFVITVNGSFGISKISNGSLESNKGQGEQFSWATSSHTGYTAGIGIDYYLNDNISVRSGLEFNNYTTDFSLPATTDGYTDTKLMTDINSSAYYKHISTFNDAVPPPPFDSLVTIRYITLPALFAYTSGKPGKLGFYGEGGLKLSIPLSSTYTNNGYYGKGGYYPSNPTVAQYLYIPELGAGFYEKTSVNETGKVGVKGINLALYLSAGVNLPLGYYTSVTVGPEITIGLSDIMKGNKNYYDIFGYQYDKPTKLMNFGLKATFAYKL